MDEKELKKTELNSLTSEEYRMLAEAHWNTAKNQWKTFLLTGVFVIATVVIVFATLGWFMANNSVESSGMQVIPNSNGIELRSYGEAGVHDDILKQLMGENGEYGFWYRLTGSPLDTSLDMASVNWLLSDESNIGNVGEVDWTTTEQERGEYAIEPGDQGELKFYVVPHMDGDLSVYCTLEVFPYLYTETGCDYINSENYAYDFIKGHILFGLIEEVGGKKTLHWIKDGTVSINIEGARADEEYGYTLFWVWPQTFSEIVLSEGDDYLNGRDVVFSEFANGEEIREELMEMIKEEPQKFFYSSLVKAPLSSEYSGLLSIDAIGEHEGNVSGLEQKVVQDFIDMSSYYNQADQTIGKNVSFLRIKLTAVN